MLVGLALALTRTPGQQELEQHLRGNAIVYSPRDTLDFVEQILRWHRDRGLLVRAKQAAWEAANRCWHWDHPLEKRRLLRAVARVTG